MESQKFDHIDSVLPRQIIDGWSNNLSELPPVFSDKRSEPQTEGFPRVIDNALALSTNTEINV